MVNFTQGQLSTATTVWNILKQYGYNDFSAAGVIGNLYAESNLNPNINEGSGGGGYGLGQWTPKSNLYAQAKILGISNAEAETAAGQAKIIAQGDRTGQWSIYGNPAYHSTVVVQQTLAQFKQSGSVISGAANFCAHWERPRVDVAHMDVRIDAANSIYQKLKGSSGGGTNKGEMLMWALYQANPNVPTRFFNGVHAYPVANADEIEAVKQIYRANTGKELPVMTNWNDASPFYDRLGSLMSRRVDF